MDGLLVTFEGGEGTGKSTQIAGLRAWLAAAGHAVLETRDPGGTAIGEAARAILLDRAHHRMSPLAELLLYEACRAQLVRELIRPALAEGRIVLCDRFGDSTLAYQGAGRGLDPGLIGRLNDLAADGLRPDLTLLFDLDPAAGLARVVGRGERPGGGGDRMEGERLAFHQRVREGFLAIAAAEADRVVVLDASRGVEETAAEIRRQVAARLPRLAPPPVRG